LIVLIIFRGKFAQRPDMPKTKIISERHELLYLLTTAGVEITGILADLGDKVVVTYTDEASEAKNTNVVTAATTTTNARILLYKLLLKLGDRVLYFDTGMNILLL
jgi:hypothetical protein